MSRHPDNLLDIKGFAFDVDGVFTDGGILCDLQGELYRTFDAKDGFGVRMARLKGYPVAVITGGRSESIRQRFLTSGVDPADIYLHSRDKSEQMEDFCRRHGFTTDNVLFMGDDLPDLELIERCGIGASPADGVPEALAAADWVTERPGGQGAVREVIETVMRAQGTWVFDVERYKVLF